MADEKPMGVNELYPKPAPDPNYVEKKDPASDLRRGMAKSLMQSAFMKFGEAFTDTGDVKKDAATRESRLSPFVQAGAGVADALSNRWYQMELDNFDNETIQPYRAQSTQLLDDFQRRSAQADLGIFEGPDGQPIELNMKNKEDRLKAVAMRNQLTKRFFALKTDMDLDFLAAVGKYESNPLIRARGEALTNATSSVLTMNSNPAPALEAEDKMSQIRFREAQAESDMVRAKATASQAEKKNRPVSYNEAINHPDVGHRGIMQWFLTDPAGIQILESETGGGAFVTEERGYVMSKVLAAHPEWGPDDPEAIAAVDARRSEWMLNATKRLIKKLSPEDYEQIKQAVPQFFEERSKEAGVVDDKRLGPQARKDKVDRWKQFGSDYFTKWFQNPDNSGDIEDAMSDFNEWLRAAIYGETEQPELQQFTLARGKGTEKLAEEILEEVPKYVREWALEGGSDLAAELNPSEADLRKRAKGGGKMGRLAKGILRDRERERKEGILP